MADTLDELIAALANQCPCGAREESLHTHPHIGGCITEEYRAWRARLVELRDRWQAQATRFGLAGVNAQIVEVLRYCADELTALIERKP